jgi:hypothetical protein
MLFASLLLVWFILPVLMWFANLLIRIPTNPKYRIVLIGLFCVLTAIAGYIVLLTSVWVLDTHLEAEMNKFDLDGDGGIGGAELTPEAERAIEEWASDTGRTFAPIVGIPLTAIWYGMLFAVLFGGEWVFRKVLFSDGAPPNRRTIDATIKPPRPDDGNPYQSPNVG